jgi:hypothetical protein
MPAAYLQQCMTDSLAAAWQQPLKRQGPLLRMSLHVVSARVLLHIHMEVTAHECIQGSTVASVELEKLTGAACMHMSKNRLYG